MHLFPIYAHACKHAGTATCYDSRTCMVTQAGQETSAVPAGSTLVCRRSQAHPPPVSWTSDLPPRFKNPASCGAFDKDCELTRWPKSVVCNSLRVLVCVAGSCLCFICWVSTYSCSLHRIYDHAFREFQHFSRFCYSVSCRRKRLNSCHVAFGE